MGIYVYGLLFHSRGQDIIYDSIEPFIHFKTSCIFIIKLNKLIKKGLIRIQLSFIKDLDIFHCSLPSLGFTGI